MVLIRLAWSIYFPQLPNIAGRANDIANFERLCSKRFSHIRGCASKTKSDCLKYLQFKTFRSLTIVIFKLSDFKESKVNNSLINFINIYIYNIIIK